MGHCLNLPSNLEGESIVGLNENGDEIGGKFLCLLVVGLLDQLEQWHQEEIETSYCAGHLLDGGWQAQYLILHGQE